MGERKELVIPVHSDSAQKKIWPKIGNLIKQNKVDIINADTHVKLRLRF